MSYEMNEDDYQSTLGTDKFVSIIGFNVKDFVVEPDCD
jgi:hypothetical protein